MANMFAIINGLPYLIHNGMAIPVNMKNNGSYKPEPSQAFKTEEFGRYTEREIIAKCKTLNSVKKENGKKER